MAGDALKTTPPPHTPGNVDIHDAGQVSVQLEKFKEGIIRVQDMMAKVNQLRIAVHSMYDIDTSEAPPDIARKFNYAYQNAHGCFKDLTQMVDAASNVLIYAQSKGMTANLDIKPIYTNEVVLRASVDPTFLSIRTNSSDQALPLQSSLKESGSESQIDSLDFTSLSNDIIDRYPSVPLLDDIINSWRILRATDVGDTIINKITTGENGHSGVQQHHQYEIILPGVLRAKLDVRLDEDNALYIDQLIFHGIKEHKNFTEESEHGVFQKVTQIGLLAIESFSHSPPEKAIHDLLTWISSYQDLLTAPCQKCRKILRFDSPQFKFLPPALRTWKGIQTGARSSKTATNEGESGLAYHPQCL